MTDFAKRRSLKCLAAAAAGTATAGFTIPSIAETDLGNGTTTPFVSEAHLAIHTRLSVKGNDIEVVFVNAGADTLSIETLTPHEVTTFRGRFNIGALTADKPLVLAPGKSVSVAISSHGSEMDFHEMIRQGQSLTRALQTSASAYTTDGAHVHISVNETQPFA